MAIENANVPLSIHKTFGAMTGNLLKPVGVLKLIVAKAVDLKCPKDKGIFLLLYTLWYIRLTL